MDGGRKARRDFFDAMKRMEPADAFVLNAVGEIHARGGGYGDEMIRQLAHEASKAGISAMDVPISTGALTELKCFLLSANHTQEIIPFGRALLAACRPPT